MNSPSFGSMKTVQVIADRARLVRFFHHAMLTSDKVEPTSS
jgi:hypothetical protein